MISAMPDIKRITIEPEDEFMVLACDGIWNFMTSDDVIEFVQERISDPSKKLSKICEEVSYGKTTCWSGFQFIIICVLMVLDHILHTFFSMTYDVSIKVVDN